jgi:pimeloyl-ACP methyl ester carboxylesterase
MKIPEVRHRFADVDGLRVFYREAGPRDAPVLVLLHGFPSASHQFRRLLDALGDRYHLIAPDYPGFGYSDAPVPTTAGGTFDYTFDRLADVIEGLCRAIGLTRFALYVFDFGAPVGFRLAVRHPEWITGLVVQNANAYEDGLSPIARDLISLRRGVDGAEAKLRGILTPAFTRSQYLEGASAPERIDPGSWLLDQYFLELPGRKDIQVDLALDYGSNVARYPQWQAWLRERKPPTLIVWGKADAIFLADGARAYLRDVPGAELHLFETGHFALEECLPQIAPLIAGFLDGLTGAAG